MIIPDCGISPSGEKSPEPLVDRLLNTNFVSTN